MLPKRISKEKMVDTPTIAHIPVPISVGLQGCEHMKLEIKCELPSGLITKTHNISCHAKVI